MPKITSVEPQKKSASRRTKRYNIFLDGHFAFGADEDLIVDRRLVVGKNIDSQDLEKILFEAEVGKLMERMYRLFNIRQRSEREVRNYFRIKGKEEVSDLAVDNLVKRLKTKGMVNDREFAQNWVRARAKRKGRVAIKMELFKKGVDYKVINESLKQIREADEVKLAQQILEKKSKSWQSLPWVEFKRKAYDFLMRRGFDYEIVREVIENYLKKV